MKFNQGDVVIKKETKIDKNKKRSFVENQLSIIYYLKKI